METWFTKIFCFRKEDTPRPADGAKSAGSQVRAGRTIPADAGRTAPLPSD